MPEAWIVANARTPLGKSFRGALNATRPDVMAAVAIKGALAQVPQLDAAEIDLTGSTKIKLSAAQVEIN